MDDASVKPLPPKKDESSQAKTTTTTEKVIVNQNLFPITKKRIQINDTPIGKNRGSSDDILFGIVNRGLEKNHFPFLLNSRFSLYQSSDENQQKNTPITTTIIEEEIYQSETHRDLIPSGDDNGGETESAAAAATATVLSSIHCYSTFLQWMLALHHMQVKHMISFCGFSLKKMTFDEITKETFKDGVALVEIYAPKQRQSEPTLGFKFCFVDQQNRDENLLGVTKKYDQTDGTLIWRFRLDHDILFDSRLLFDKTISEKDWFAYRLQDGLFSSFKTVKSQQRFINQQNIKNSMELTRDFPSPESYFITATSRGSDDHHHHGKKKKQEQRFVTHVPYATDVWRLALSMISLCCWKNKDTLQRDYYGSSSSSSSSSESATENLLRWEDPQTLFTLHEKLFMSNTNNENTTVYSHPSLKKIYSELIDEFTRSLREFNLGNKEDAIRIIGICVLQYSIGNGLLPDDSVSRLSCYKDSKILEILTTHGKIPHLLQSLIEFTSNFSLFPMYHLLRKPGDTFKFNPRDSDLQFPREKSRHKRRKNSTFPKKTSITTVIPCDLHFDRINLFHPVLDVVRKELGSEGVTLLQTLMSWEPHSRFVFDNQNDNNNSFFPKTTQRNEVSNFPSLLTILSSPYFSGNQQFKHTPTQIERKGYQFSSSSSKHDSMVDDQQQQQQLANIVNPDPVPPHHFELESPSSGLIIPDEYYVPNPLVHDDQLEYLTFLYIVKDIVKKRCKIVSKNIKDSFGTLAVGVVTADGNDSGVTLE